MVNPSEEDNNVNEPAAAYTSSRLRIYNSFQQANESENINAAKQSPEERLKEVVQLIMRTYGVTESILRERSKSNKITIKIAE